MKFLKYVFVLCTICLFVIACQKKQQEIPPALFQDVDTKVSIDTSGNPAVVAVKNIKLNLGLLKERTSKLRITLFDTEFIDIERLDVKESAQKRYRPKGTISTIMCK